jgi:hypothetical protein
MQNFDQRKKRKLLTDNIIKMKAVNKFINVALFPVINKKYKKWKKNVGFSYSCGKIRLFTTFL